MREICLFLRIAVFAMSDMSNNNLMVVSSSNDNFRLFLTFYKYFIDIIDR